MSEQHTVTSLNSQLSQITQEISALLAQFASGFLSRQQLFDVLYPLVPPIATQYGLSPYLVLGVITEESGGNAKVVSYTDAIGLMQIEPSTAAEWGVTDTNELYDPVTNVTTGCEILRWLMGKYASYGSLGETMALAAYNSGSGNVDHSIKVSPASDPLSWLYSQSWGSGVEQYANNIEALQALYESWGAP